MLRVIAFSLGTVLIAGQASATDWTGFYVGGQVGNADVNTNVAGVDDNGVIGGLTAGYDYDLGSWVVGAGVDYDWSDTNLGGVTTLDRVGRVKLRGGYKFGDGLFYGVGGYAHAKTDTLGNDDGWFIGAGYEHLVTDNVSLKGEILYHDFKNFNNSGTNLDATTIQIGATFRF